MVGVVGVVGALGSTAALRRLDYSTSWIVGGAADEAAMAPTASSIRVGELEWRVPLYAQAPELEPYRLEFAGCGALEGLDAATCVYAVLDRSSPLGDPITEFVDASYDPSFALAQHLKGAAGHCTTRAALTSTALLAFGKPARVVQLLPGHGNGHNLTEVFDPQKGWVIFDPSTGDWLADEQGHPVSAASIARGSAVRWARMKAGPDVSVYRFATALFPEPWLYTRVGQRAATWPFRGTFVRLGTRFDVGPLQKATVVAVLLFAAVAAFAALRVLVGLRRPRPTPSARPTGDAPMGVADRGTRASAP
jgi:hypothetical protein